MIRGGGERRKRSGRNTLQGKITFLIFMVIVVIVVLLVIMVVVIMVIVL